MLKGLFLASLMLSLTGCGSVLVESQTLDAMCGRIAADRTALADALVEDGGPASQLAGIGLIAKLDAGCDDR